MDEAVDAPRSSLFGPEDAHDESVWVDRDNLPVAPDGDWYHVSPTDLDIDTVLRPFHGETPWTDDPYEGGLGNRANYIWVEHDPAKARGWMKYVLQHQPMCYLYRVQPRLGPFAWNGTADEGWVTDRAVVLEKLPVTERQFTAAGGQLPLFPQPKKVPRPRSAPAPEPGPAAPRGTQNPFPTQGMDGFRWSDTLPLNKMYDAVMAKYNAANDDVKRWGSEWYDSAHQYVQNLAQKTNRTPEQVAAVMAAFSPRTAWDPNMAQATHFLLQYDPNNPDALDTQWPGLGENLTRAKRIVDGPGDHDSVLKALEGSGKDAPKITSFYKNMMGDEDAVTIDTWMARAILGEGLDMAPGDPAQNALSWAGAYDRMGEAVRRAAKDLGISPRALQAIVWTHVNPTADYREMTPDLYQQQEERKQKNWNKKPPGKSVPDYTKGPAWDAKNDHGEHILPQPTYKNAPGYNRTAGRDDWYHTSPYKLPVGTVLVPGGGKSRYEPYYRAVGEQQRKDHVWVENDLKRLKRWHDIDSEVNYHYRVEPDGDPRPYRGGDYSQGWVVPSARIVEELGPAKRKGSRPPRPYLYDWTPPVDEDGMVTLYHRTSPEAAESIVTDQRFIPGKKWAPDRPEMWDKLDDEVWFATDPDGPPAYRSGIARKDFSEQYGAGIVKVRVPADKVYFSGVGFDDKPGDVVFAKVYPEDLAGVPIDRHGFKRTAADEEERPRLEDLVSEVETGNGRWHYPYSYFSPNDFSGYGMHNWEVAPVNAPAVFDGESYGRKKRVYYDPARVTVENGEFRPQVNHPEGAVFHLEDDPDTDLLWRGMSHEEYERAKELGYFESNGSYNLGQEQDGKTFFSTQRSSASTYANGFAPWQYAPTFDRPAHVVGIPNRPDVPRGPLGNDPKSHEVGISGRIPFSEVSDHWVGNVAALQPGEWTGTSDPYYSDINPPSRSLSPRAELHWERDPQFAPRTAYRTAMPQADAYDPDAEWLDDYTPERGIKPYPNPSGKWYHVSPHKLPPGTVLTPGGGPTPWEKAYGRGLPKERQKWVWMDSQDGVEDWHQGVLVSLVGQGQENPWAYVYEVQPSEGPYVWNGTGKAGLAAPSATIVGEVPTDKYNRITWPDKAASRKYALELNEEEARAFLDYVKNNKIKFKLEDEGEPVKGIPIAELEKMFAPMKPSGTWYHVSPHELPDGTTLVPGGPDGKATSQDFYDTGFGDDSGTLQDMGAGRNRHVWVTPDREDANFWAAALGAPHIYEVDPDDDPQPWNGTGVDGWVTRGGRIRRKLTDDD